MTNGQIISRFDLPDRSDGTADSPILVDGPRIAGSAGDGRVLIDRPWISWSPANSPSSYQESRDAFLASSSGEKLDDAQPLDGIDDCDVDVTSGSVNGGGWWLACNMSDGLRVRRFDNHDVPLGDTSIETTWLDASDLQATVAPDPSGRALFVWDPTSQDLTRLDLATGETTDGHGTPPTADLLSALGAWIEPAAAAKTIATPTITVSPDGTRVYALGFFQQPIDHGHAIPASGVSAFDATSLDLEWEAGGGDAHSIATNADGSLVLWQPVGPPLRLKRGSPRRVSTSCPLTTSATSPSTSRVRSYRRPTRRSVSAAIVRSSRASITRTDAASSRSVARRSTISTSNLGGVLANPTGKDDSVDPRQTRGRGGDRFGGTTHEHGRGRAWPDRRRRKTRPAPSPFPRLRPRPPAARIRARARPASQWRPSDRR